MTANSIGWCFHRSQIVRDPDTCCKQFQILSKGFRRTLRESQWKTRVAGCGYAVDACRVHDEDNITGSKTSSGAQRTLVVTTKDSESLPHSLCFEY